MQYKCFIDALLSSFSAFASPGNYLLATDCLFITYLCMFQSVSYVHAPVLSSCSCSQLCIRLVFLLVLVLFRCVYCMCVLWSQLWLESVINTNNFSSLTGRVIVIYYCLIVLAMPVTSYCFQYEIFLYVWFNIIKLDSAAAFCIIELAIFQKWISSTRLDLEL